MHINEVTNEMLLEELQRRFTQRDAFIEDSKLMMQELQEMNAKLVKSEENKSLFMSRVKNEFNNPLASIISLSDSLLKLSVDEKVKHIAFSLSEEALMLAFEIKNIICASDIESGTLSIEPTKIDFFDIVHRAKEELRYPLHNKKAELSVKIDTNDVIYGDVEKIYLIVLNLLSNAIEFSPTGSNVIFEISNDEQNIKIFVKDFGEGIKESEKENIYKRFYQAHSGLNRAHRGLGLGLSIVKDLVEILDGSIEFESVEGEYTFFEISIAKQSKEQDAMFDDDDFMFSADASSEEF